MKDEFLEQAQAFFHQFGTISLAISHHNQPILHPMEKVAEHGWNQILVISKKDSAKVRTLRENNLCCTEVHDEVNSVRLLGKVTVMEDPDEILASIPDSYRERLLKAGVEGYCVLQIDSWMAQVYINGNFREYPLTKKTPI